jgi:glyoxylase-like metal-dependent hydrolase (beta-lactamase superfamily II)
MGVCMSVGTVETTGAAQYRAWRERTDPPVERLAGGWWSIPVPIPDNPLRYTLSYLLTTDTDAIVVDPGWNAPECWDALTAGLRTAGVAAADVTGVVVTHVHPDHHGLSGRLREASGCWVGMHPAERATLTDLGAGAGGSQRLEETRRWLVGLGAPESDLAAIFAGFSAHTRAAARGGGPAAPDVLLDDGAELPVAGRRVGVIWTPGHTPGHICLLDAASGAMLTGDHVLPRITPNVALHPDRDDPVRDYLDSLRRVGEHDDVEVLPAHEYRFRGLAARTEQIREHHAVRGAEIVTVVNDLGEATLWQIAERLTWSRPWPEIGMMRMSALAETAAHVRYLAGRGELTWPDHGPVRRAG